MKQEEVHICYKNSKFLSEMHEGYLVAVIRGKSKEEGKEIAIQTYKGGIKALEITFSTPGQKILLQS